MYAVDLFINFKTYDDKTLSIWQDLKRKHTFPPFITAQPQSSLLAANLKIFLIVAAAS